MINYLSSNMTEDELGSISTLALAHIGDAIYELLVRTWLCAHGKHTAKGLHTKTVSYVRAQAQAVAVQKILPTLSDAEQAIYKRGRNAKVNTVPKNADIADYHAATGLEALVGYLYLKGDTGRINELFAIIVGD